MGYILRPCLKKKQKTNIMNLEVFAYFWKELYKIVANSFLLSSSPVKPHGLENCFKIMN
jgi:hypothetical protein